MKGRIVVVKEYGKPFEIEEYDVPEPEPGATLLRMTQAGICGSDLHTWRGDQTQEHMPLPPSGRVMGHEGTGVVEVLGEGVSTDTLGTPIEEGDRIVYSAVFPCSRCHLCLRGDTNWCANRAYPTAGVYPYFTGTYADYSIPSTPAIPSSKYRTNCPTTCWARLIAPWGPLLQV